MQSAEKRAYSVPEVEIYNFKTEDIIATSPIKDDEGEYSPTYPL